MQTDFSQIKRENSISSMFGGKKNRSQCEWEEEGIMNVCNEELQALIHLILRGLGTLAAFY